MSVPIVRRAQWGARAPRARNLLSTAAIDELVVHYTAALSDELPDHAGCAARVRGIQNFHMQPGGLGAPDGGSDIAYNWLFCRHGVAFEGRGWLVQSGATFGHNRHTQAICFLGADRAGRDDVTAAGRRAAAALIRGGIRAIGHPLGVVGHGDRVSTACPGDELEAWIRVGGWLVDDPDAKPWPIPIPPAYWTWIAWQRRRFLFPSRAAWLRARPRGVRLRVPRWYFVRAAAMGGLRPPERG